jgi:hypothetical protein
MTLQVEEDHTSGFELVSDELIGTGESPAAGTIGQRAGSTVFDIHQHVRKNDTVSRPLDASRSAWFGLQQPLRVHIKSGVVRDGIAGVKDQYGFFTVRAANNSSDLAPVTRKAESKYSKSGLVSRWSVYLKIPDPVEARPLNSSCQN